MTIKEIKELAVHAARGTAPANFSVDSVNAALADALKTLGDLHGSFNEFQRNKLDIFDIIIQNADEIVPKKVIDAFGSFAEIQVVPQGNKPMFKVKPIGKNRARKFLTQVGLSGVYETFRLDAKTYTIPVHAVGGAVTMDFERWLDGAENLADLMDVLTEGLTDAVYCEVQKALIAAINASNRPAVNKVSGSYSAAALQGLITIVKSYADGAVIFATPEFVTAMGPDAIVAGSANYQGIYNPRDIDAIANTGRIKSFRGTPIVEIPQSFIDENNVKTWVNPQYAFILPTNREKVVKIVLEGQTQMWDWVNKDQSVEVNVYKKMGAAILTNHDWCIYRNTDIPDTSATVYGYQN